MPRDLVVVGASAGGVESLRELVSHLDPSLPAAVLVVLHLPASSPSMLPAILSRVGPLPAVAARGREELVPGRILVAPPDFHLVVLDGHANLTRGPRENGHRPAVDVLFRSAAWVAGPRVIGLVLSGTLDDGTAGMMSIRQRGGLVLAQSPDEATYPSMPANVIRAVGADHVGTVAELAAVINELAGSAVPAAAPQDPSDLMTAEVHMADMTADAFADPDRPGVPAGFSCPDCSGSLFEIDEAGMMRFRCRVGHAWSALGLLAAQSETLESALWTAFRSLEEKAALAKQLADQARERGSTLSAQQFLEKFDEASGAAAVLQRLLEQPLSTMPDHEPSEGEHAEQA